jgi:PKD repeat protein
MKKLSTLLIGLFVVLNIGLGSIAGFSMVFSDDVIAVSSRAEKTPEDYEANNVYYLCNPTLTTTIHFLKGVPLISDGANPELNKLDLTNGRPEIFSYPGQGQRKSELVYNQSFIGDPYIQLTLNSYARANKVVNVEIGIDTDNDDNFELVCTFPPYHTTGDDLDGTMEEEVYEAYGTWQGGKPPAVVVGWVKMKITMTSPNGNPCLLYCGFDSKLSWAALPYMHTDLLPRAQINLSHQLQGFEEYGKTPITVGDTIWFDGRDSYDPNDDLNGNFNIDDGYPGGEPNLGERDRLRYRWRFGDGTATTLDYPNRNVSHSYKSDSIPKHLPHMVFEVNLTVMDNEGHSDWNRTYVKVYRGNHSPVITSLKINNVEQMAPFPKKVESPLDSAIKVYFSAVATDKDEDDLTFHWDFNGDGEYEIEGDETEASSVFFTFSEPNFNSRKYRITLVVSDGTTVENATGYGNVSLVENKEPIAVIRAKRHLDPVIYTENLTVRTNQVIIFDASLSYDPDNLPGFDTDEDRKPDYPLKYRWNFNAYDSTATSGWITEKTYEHMYLSAGSEYQFTVTLDVDDGLNINTSSNFTVFVNVRPSAKIFIESGSYTSQGNFEVNRPIYFNGSGSIDPNGDPIVNYTWDFGDGNKSYGPTPVHKYSTPSEYTVSLIVKDYEYSSSPDQLKVDIPYPPKPPVIRYTINPTEVYTHQQIRFDASATFDPDSDRKDLKFKWYFGDNTTSSEANTTHRYLTDGDYHVTIEVKDEAGAVSTKSEIVVHVLNRKPVAKISQMKNVPVDETVRVSGTGSRDDDGYVVSYLWNFGDGTETSWTNESTVEHKWKHATTYTITLTVQDNHGLTNETQIQIKVKAQDSDEGLFSNEQTNNIIVGSIIVVIIIIVIIVVIIFIRRAQESI